MRNLTPGMLKALKGLIDRCSDQLSNNICNDFDLRAYLKPEEIKCLVKDFHRWNGDPEEFEQYGDNYSLPDWCILEYLMSIVFIQLEKLNAA